jgi:ribosome-interacting GTPase 1
MPANLPPQYYIAEQTYRAARGAAEKVAALQQMLAATPKHKGTDHLRADLRAKVAKGLEELENPKRGSGQPQPFVVRKEGAGQAALIGVPNAGKSQLLATLTGAAAKVAAYPFTTRIPMPGMLRFENVRVQLVDTPAISDRDIQGQLFGLLRNSDLLLIVLDLSGDPLTEADEVFSELDRFSYRLLGLGETADPEDPLVQKPALIIGTKADEPDAEVAFELLQELYGSRFPMVAVSALEETGLNQLAKDIYETLGRVRVYLKAKGSDPDTKDPLVLVRGSMVEDAAVLVHKDWLRRFKYALLWGSGKFGGQRVGRDYVLSDGDAIELHG